MFANRFGNHKNVCCGLVKMSAGKEVPIPLISVNVNAAVVHSVARVELSQVFMNTSRQPIEAIYYFPVNPEGAVIHFQAELEGRVIKGIVRPEKEAEGIYDKAVKKGLTAFLGAETTADIFKLRVGFLKPSTQVKVVIGYVTEVKNDPGSNAIRFYIPTTIAPRYASTKAIEKKAKDIDAMTFSRQSPAPISINVAVSLQGGIKSIKSPTHKVKVTKNEKIPENEAWHKALVELSTKSTDMDRDFVLNIIPEEVHNRPRLYSEKINENGRTSTAMMVHLVPGFKLKEQKTELIFLLDRSGSMSGSNIAKAKKALLMFLHSMPADCYFNVVGFGSTFKFLFSKSVKYNNGSLKKATAHANTLKADLGGTEILKPLKKIYEKAGIKGYLRQIFILTDGQVWDTDGVIGFAQANAHKARVFALGIGSGASHDLVEGVAKAGGGTSAFVTNNEGIDKKVLNQLKNGLQPSLTDIKLVWKGINPRAGGDAKLYPKQSPKKIPPVYDGSQLLAFGLFQGDQIPSGVTLKAQSPDGPVAVKMDYSPRDTVGSTGILHRLASIKLVRELEVESAALHYKNLAQTKLKQEEEKLKKAIVNLACENGISSRYTSFVAVDVNHDGKDKPSSESWVMQTRIVPSQYVPMARASYGGMLRCKSKSAGGNRRGVLMCKKSATTRRRSYAAGKTPGQQGMKRRKKAMPRSSGVKRMCMTRSKQTLKKKSTTSTSSRATRAPVVVESSSDSEWDSSESDEDVEESSSSDSEFDSSESDSDDEASTSTGTPLQQLISLQSFDGSFQLTEKLASTLKLKQGLKQLKQSATGFKLAGNVFATALAISYFETKLGRQKSVWELIVMKATQWLSTKHNRNKDKVNEVLKKAADYLKKA